MSSQKIVHLAEAAPPEVRHFQQAGLAISKAVIEAHRGLVWVKSSGQGTTFTIDLPLET